MKKITYYIASFTLAIGAFVLVSCAENDPVPDYSYVGTSTATIFTLAASNDEPVVGEEITITVNYVNQSEDPASELQTLVNIDGNGFAPLGTMNESSAPAGSEVTRSITYQVPDLASGTTIDIDVLLSTQREFPQRERVTVEVSE